MPVQIERWMFFLSLRLFKMMMIGAADLLRTKHLHHIRMITCSFWFVPDGIAVEIAREDGPFGLDDIVIQMDGFPQLPHVLVFSIRWVIGPDRKQVDLKPS